MKKIFFLISALAVIVISSVYIFIPGTLTVDDRVHIETSDAVIFKFLTHSRQWQKWWPGEKTDSTHYSYQGIQVEIGETTNSGAELIITVNKTRLKSRIAYLPGDLSVDVVWTTEISSGINPVQRVKAYRDAQKLKAGVSNILNQLKTFLQNDRNAYGYHIYIDKVKDPILLATSVNQGNYPDMQTVYATINKLKSQAILNGAKPTAFPMLNITKVSPANYQVSMALPVDKIISTDKGTFINKMVAGGNLLVTDVKGGPNTIADAFGQIKQYMKDHKLISPAMPFESLVTDRVAERDTSKWVTKIYYPIF